MPLEDGRILGHRTEPIMARPSRSTPARFLRASQSCRRHPSRMIGGWIRIVPEAANGTRHQIQRLLICTPRASWINTDIAAVDAGHLVRRGAGWPACAGSRCAKRAGERCMGSASARSAHCHALRHSTITVMGDPIRIHAESSHRAFVVVITGWRREAFPEYPPCPQSANRPARETNPNFVRFIHGYGKPA